mgnify:CR=1 FL=1
MCSGLEGSDMNLAVIHCSLKSCSLKKIDEHEQAATEPLFFLEYLYILRMGSGLYKQGRYRS